MRKPFRNALFFLFVLVFLLGAPAVVLYTAGYRYNPVNGHIVRTGVFAVSSLPRSADILLDGEITERETPYVFNRTMPGKYTVSLVREGYHRWSDTVTVESGKSTYRSNILLFLDNEPALVLEDSASLAVPSPHNDTVALLRRTDTAAQIWLTKIGDEPYMITELPAKPTDTVRLSWNGDSSGLVVENATQLSITTLTLEGITVNVDPENPVTTVNDLTLVRNAQAVDVHNGSRVTNPTVAILPLGHYDVLEYDGRYAVLLGNRRTLTLLDMSASNPLLLTVDGNVYDWNRELGKFAWSDGIEINAYDVHARTTTFITRQSDAIIDLAWHATGNALFVGTNESIVALDLATHRRVLRTELLDDMTIYRFWSDDDEYLSVFGERNGLRGIFSLQIIK